MANITFGSCPYCGQSVMGEEKDPRMVCGCHAARKYRKILDALDKQSGLADPMKPINEDVMHRLRQFADLICDHLVDGITAKLADGTTVVIGAKVSRSARLKVEEKVDE